MNVKNLIDEIEKKKGYYEYFISCDFNDGWNDAIDSCLKTLDQYNIITAPKSIKLSEIVDRLQNQFKHHLYVDENSYGVKSIGYDWFDDCIQESWFEDIVVINKNEIVKISLAFIDRNKWLYTLWIAGTEIIDDLEE